MNILGKTYMFYADSEVACSFISGSFDGIPLKDGDLVEVVEVENGFLDCYGAIKIKVHGNVLTISPDSSCWCFFTDIQTGEGTAFVEVKGKVKPEKIFEKTLSDRYDEWVLENLAVYELFCKFTHQAIASGKKKVSHWLIVNRIRWEVEVETVSTCEEDAEFKISNDYIALLARDFIKDYPEHKDIFNLKQMKRA